MPGRSHMLAALPQRHRDGSKITAARGLLVQRRSADFKNRFGVRANIMSGVRLPGFATQSTSTNMAGYSAETRAPLGGRIGSGVLLLVIKPWRAVAGAWPLQLAGRFPFDGTGSIPE